MIALEERKREIVKKIEKKGNVKGGGDNVYGKKTRKLKKSLGVRLLWRG